MSNSLAIAAVTATLRELIKRGVRDFLPNPDENVTTKPPDQARTGNTTPDRINIFLYQTVLNAAWRNMDMPRQIRPGESGQPPLALNLHYLITAYGAGDEEIKSHRWLGRAMSVLHDHPLLGAEEIRNALPDNSELQTQIERVRITPQPLSLEDMSKLWSTFQTPYRISSAYQVEVVLIESARSGRAPLPVLARGQDDTGASAQADLIPPFPTITSVRPDIQAPPSLQLGAVLGNDLIIAGHHLDIANVAVEVRHPRLPAPGRLPAPSSATATAIKVNLPNEPENYPVGLYTLVVGALVEVQPPTQPPTEKFVPKTNELPFAIAPKIELDLANPPVRDGEQVTIVLGCSPVVLPAQRVALLLGGEEVLAEPHPEPASQFTFVAKDVPAGKFAAGKYFVRLRVDGVDSQLVKHQDTPPKAFFDEAQQVEIPP